MFTTLVTFIYILLSMLNIHFTLLSKMDPIKIINLLRDIATIIDKLSDLMK